MKLFQAYLHLLIFLSLTATSIAVPKYAKKGCDYTCGNVTIPFPFGIGEDCSVNHWYTVNCNNSTPYLSALNNLEVLGVNLSNLTVTVLSSRITNCQNPVLNSSEILGVDLDGSPYFFSTLNNKFVFNGCGNAVMTADNGSVITGCSTTCRNDTLSDTNNCFGISCCEKTGIPYLQSYRINITNLDSEDGGCGSAFLADTTAYGQQRRKASSIPVSLLWTLADSDHLMCCVFPTPRRNKVELFNGTLMDASTCFVTPGWSVGSPYLIDGCDVGEESLEAKCRRCNDNGGLCNFDWTYNLLGSIYSGKVTCYYDEKRNAKPSKISLGLILGKPIL
ncbi:putative wall-associated receptor kinase, galacturonan-binding domain-containing protein [Helianthus annuus]|nr:putative wall-associated receptor kinase, galacturonan-binding domain-containing protein [Helianthus annuus]